MDRKEQWTFNWRIQFLFLCFFLVPSSFLPRQQFPSNLWLIIDADWERANKTRPNRFPGTDVLLRATVYRSVRFSRLAIAGNQLGRILESETVHRQRIRRPKRVRLALRLLRFARSGDRLRETTRQRNLSGIHGTEPVSIRYSGIPSKVLSNVIWTYWVHHNVLLSLGQSLSLKIISTTALVSFFLVSNPENKT